MSNGTGDWGGVMPSLIDKALAAKRESKHIEFKVGFDPASGHDWCECIKDIVALANSGGGVLIFGLTSHGLPVGQPIGMAGVDPADVGNRIRNYVGSVELLFEIAELTKDGQPLIGLLIQPAPLPIVFVRPGTYPDGKGGQKTAFGQGTVYFRHGAKSEPGSSDDVRQVFERQLESVRRAWTKSVRRVVEAPPGTEFVPVATVGRETALPSRVQVVKESGALPVRLTRDEKIASGTFLHEEISEGIFDEINNVIDANRALAQGSDAFLLGHEVYYRIYAERQHVRQSEVEIELLFRNGLRIYAPSAYWLLALPDKAAAEALVDAYLHPIYPQVHALLRFAVLFGEDFSDWLFARLQAKWGMHPQPPKFYWAFKEMRAKAAVDPRLAATRMRPASTVEVSAVPAVTALELMAAPERAATLLSKACMDAFATKSNASACRALARNLDCYAYGPAIMTRGRALGSALQRLIGDRNSGDVLETTEFEQA
jgi:Putative DNA-binding domain